MENGQSGSLIAKARANPAKSQVLSVAVFATHVDLQATIDGSDWSGQVWVTDLWRRTKLRRNWRMVERVLTLYDGAEDGEIDYLFAMLRRFAAEAY